MFGAYESFIFNFLGLHTIFHNAWTILNSHASMQRYAMVSIFHIFNTSYILILIFFHSNHLTGCDVIISLCFWFAFPWRIAILSIFSHTCWPFMSSLQKCLLKSFDQFKFELVFLLLFSSLSFKSSS
jgi:hypothetical protein